MIFKMIRITWLLIIISLFGIKGDDSKSNTNYTFETKIGETFDVSVTRSIKDDEKEECVIVDPHNNEYSFNDISSHYNIQVLGDDNIFVCSVTFGPVTLSMDGDWTLVAKMINSTGDNEHYELQQQFTVEIKDPENDLDPDDDTIEITDDNNQIIDNDQDDDEKDLDVNSDLDNDTIEITDDNNQIIDNDQDDDDEEDIEADSNPEDDQNEITDDAGETAENGANTTEVISVAGKSITLSCSAQTSIDYCWFGSQNGTTFSVGPYTTTTNIKYSGRGFEFGDCSMTIISAGTADTGTWTCNVGIAGHVDPTVKINVIVKSSPIVLRAGMVNRRRRSYFLITGSTYDGSPVQYCRFISPSGQGFNSPVRSRKYDTSFSNTTAGYCALRIYNPSMSDITPWVIAAHIVGENEESLANIRITATFTSGGSGFLFFITWMLLVTFLTLVIVIVVSSATARTWTRNTASRIRSSFRKNNSTSARNSPPPPAYAP